MSVDTVKNAQASPDEEMPYAELGLQKDEYAKILELLGRRPTQSELAMYSIMWSEHCSYKSSKVHLRQFSEKAPPSERLLAGITNAAGNVVGLMPHPEHAIERGFGPDPRSGTDGLDGLGFFTSILKHLAGATA